MTLASLDLDPDPSQQIRGAIGRITQTRGETNTAAALRDVRRHYFSAERSARAGIVRLAIIVTDGRSDDPARTALEAALLRNTGVHVFAIGVGHDIDVEVRVLRGETCHETMENSKQAKFIGFVSAVLRQAPDPVHIYHCPYALRCTPKYFHVTYAPVSGSSRHT